MKRKSIALLLGLFFVSSAFSPACLALKDLKLPFNLSDKKVKIEDANNAIRNGVRLLSAGFLAYHTVGKSLINTGKIILDLPVEDVIITNMDIDMNDPEEKLAAIPLFMIRGCIGGLLSAFLYKGDYQDYQFVLFLAALGVFEYLPGA